MYRARAESEGHLPWALSKRGHMTAPGSALGMEEVLTACALHSFITSLQVQSDCSDRPSSSRENLKMTALCRMQCKAVTSRFSLEEEEALAASKGVSTRERTGGHKTTAASTLSPGENPEVTSQCT